mmetsp:Transcript_97431/g.209051  ORF Transcript_97431/g.209051 Transcript_97431/m.209051 type:complete len:204 (+) Transcript_97431:1154-1765(+)
MEERLGEAGIKPQPPSVLPALVGVSGDDCSMEAPRTPIFSWPQSIQRLCAICMSRATPAYRSQLRTSRVQKAACPLPPQLGPQAARATKSQSTSSARGPNRIAVLARSATAARATSIGSPRVSSTRSQTAPGSAKSRSKATAAGLPRGWQLMASPGQLLSPDRWVRAPERNVAAKRSQRTCAATRPMSRHQTTSPRYNTKLTV